MSRHVGTGCRIVLLLVMLGTACQSAERFGDTFPADGATLEILREQAGAFSNLRRPVKWVMHDRRSLARALAEIGPVDFEREMVLVVGAGPTPSPEYGVRIQRVYRAGPVLKADIQYSYPTADAAPSPVAASPYHIVVTPRSDLNVEGFTAPGDTAARTKPIARPKRRARSG
jgi:hypothetical protein